jgi:putative nucleotidyltransferase with HDIG domain
MITMERIMQVISDLSPLPPTAPRLAQVVSDPQSSVDDVAKLLQYDQALTLDVLKYANSVMSASARTISTVKDAVVRLGGARILERVVARHVKGVMQAPLASYGYSEKDLWRHSVAAAVAAEQLGSYTKSATAGQSFTAALLHDIGKLILGRTAPLEDMDAIFKLVFTDKKAATCEQAERTVLGFSHADIGAEVAASWQLPPLIVEAIRHHHSLNHAQESVTDAVKIANIAARTIGEGIGNEGMSIAVDSELSQRAGITRDQFEALCAQTSQRLGAVLSMFDM